MNMMDVICSPTFIWLAIAIGLALIEAVTLGLTCIWFAGGAFVTAIVSMADIPVIAQVTIFVIVSCLLFFFTAPIVKKKFNNQVEQTNINSVVGMTGSVVEPVTAEKIGRVSLDGKLWTARLEEGSPGLEKGSLATVKDVRGVTLIVSAQQ